MNLRLLKCHGAGNDFPLIDARGLDLSPGDWATVARLLSDRAGPVGGDGLLLLTPGRRGAAFGMIMYNPDGTEAETCLNGLRCVARAGFEALGIDRADVSLHSSTAHVAAAEPLAPGVYTVEERAGPADLDPRTWPMGGAGERLVDAIIPALSAEWRFTAVAMPNPHLIHFADALDEPELVRIGLACEAAPDWLPNRANVSVAVPDGRGGLFVRTHERGAGLTDACGSAIAASTVVAGLTGRMPFGSVVPIATRGGPLRAFAETVALSEPSEPSTASAGPIVTLWGNATWEWRGSIALDLSAGTAGDPVVDHRHDDEAASWSAAWAAARA
jgi:diaminopimelate epimerase